MKRKEHKTYTMNDDIYFKINSHGHKWLNEKATEFHKKHPTCDIRYKPMPWKGEWYKQQFWWILQNFGEVIYSGQLLPIYDLTFDEPPEE